LNKSEHPNFIKLISSFHDERKLYYVLEYCPNRDLACFIRSQGVFSYEVARFYSAEIINALQYMKEMKVAHRDLKPENMALDSNMHIKIVISLFYY
jgi:serine/threonine protein kinase